jgi:hypothetical protein
VSGHDYGDATQLTGFAGWMEIRRRSKIPAEQRISDDMEIHQHSFHFIFI